MLKTKIIEVMFDPEGKKPIETELGWTWMGEVPVDKRMLSPEKAEKTPPFVVKVNDIPHFVIGHSWEIRAVSEEYAAQPAVLVLIVQKIPESRLVLAGAADLEVINDIVPKPGNC